MKTYNTFDDILSDMLTEPDYIEEMLIEQEQHNNNDKDDFLDRVLSSTPDSFEEPEFEDSVDMNQNVDTSNNDNADDVDDGDEAENNDVLIELEPVDEKPASGYEFNPSDADNNGESDIFDNNFYDGLENDVPEIAADNLSVDSDTDETASEIPEDYTSDSLPENNDSSDRYNYGQDQDDRQSEGSSFPDVPSIDEPEASPDMPEPDLGDVEIQNNFEPETPDDTIGTESDVDKDDVPDSDYDLTDFLEIPEYQDVDNSSQGNDVSVDNNDSREQSVEVPEASVDTGDNLIDGIDNFYDVPEYDCSSDGNPDIDFNNDDISGFDDIPELPETSDADIPEQDVDVRPSDNVDVPAESGRGAEAVIEAEAGSELAALL